MKRYEFLKRIYNGGIKQAKGEDKEALRKARECYLLACDLRAHKGVSNSKIIAQVGLKALCVEQDNEAYNLLWGALNALAS